MPLYEYECQSCGARFEHLHLDRHAKVSCKVCESSKLVRLLSTFAIVSSSTRAAAALEPGPCGACGAPQRGMCETMN